MSRARATDLPGAVLVEGRRFGDERGFLAEVYHRDRYRALGVDVDFVQDNLSYSRRGVLRGLHLQHPHGQAKLVSAWQGEVFDVAVDVRIGSPTFGCWTGAQLSAENGRQLFVPTGFAHGFCVVSDVALVAYKCSDVYHPEAEHTVRWDDPDIGIEWPVAAPELSDRDRDASALADIDRDALPRYEPGT